MVIRKAVPSELLQAKKISSIAFEYPVDCNDPDILALNEKADSPALKPVDNIWCAFDGDTMMAKIQIPMYQVRFDGHVVPLAGIGGVATLPQYRNRGAIRGCFIEAFREMRENGTLFSYLYPFSTNYYHMFGYTPGCQMTTWRVPITSLPKEKLSGSISLYEKGDSIADIQKVYAAATSQYNMASVKEDRQFKHIAQVDCYSDQQKYVYLYRDCTGEPKAYFCFRRVREGQETVMACEDFFFIGRESFTELLRFMSSFQPRYTAVSFTVPASLPLFGYFSECNGIQRSLSSQGMWRVVDVKQVLKLARYQGSGSFVIKVMDKYCPWNTDVFRVRFVNNLCQTVERCADAPDLEADIADFTDLICGNVTADDLYFHPLICTNGNLENLKKAFYRKSCWFHEWF